MEVEYSGGSAISSGTEPPVHSSSSGQAAASTSLPSLRRRKAKGTHAAGTSTSLKLSFRVGDPKTHLVSEAHARVFLNMYVRKMQRRVRGKKNNDGVCCEFFVVCVLVTIIILLGWDDDDSEEHEWKNSDTFGVLGILAFTILVFLVGSVLGDSPYAGMLRWMLVYIPLICGIAGQSFYEEVRQDKITIFELPLEGSYWAWFLLAAAELLVFTAFMTYYVGFPKLMQSAWIRNNPGIVANIWRVGIIDDWTMGYRGHNPAHGIDTKCQLHYNCKYDGDTDPSTGLPDGLGRWLDDAVEGEMLTGYWKQGSPVAPFSSWNVGTDDAILAVRVAYFKATDDRIDRNKFFPTNDRDPPECGVASVECSVSGSFYNHLPHVTFIEGPLVVDQMPSRQNNPIREVLGHLFQLAEAGEDANTSITIQATDPRGVQVLNHVNARTKSFYSPDTRQITVDVERGMYEGGGMYANNQKPMENSESIQRSARYLQKTLFMPKSSSSLSLSKSTLVEIALRDSIKDEESNHGFDSSEGIDLQDPAQPPQITTEKQLLPQNEFATLRVHGWIPYMYKEALIFCPGYNSCLKDSLKNFGQFLSMTKLSRYVYPVVFQWPGSRNLGYPYASRISATDINQQNMLKLVNGLAAAGVEKVHFMSHSIGVQSLLGAFRDKYDKDGTRIGRSDVSMCFQLDPNFNDTTVPQESRRMVCKSITLLNADFPVRAFVDRAYLSIRRVCQTITVVGDQNDRALRWSSFFNGMAPLFGYEYPEVLRPSIVPYKRRLALMERVGCSIEKLYFPAAAGQQHYNNEDENTETFPTTCFADKEKRYWLDMDVIDMTGLDTNIKGMRHSGFSLNGMLLKDLEELISSGKRAIQRSTLLFRQGNVFSYAHAPAFVAQ